MYRYPVDHAFAQLDGVITRDRGKPRVPPNFDDLPLPKSIRKSLRRAWFTGFDAGKCTMNYFVTKPPPKSIYPVVKKRKP